MHRDVLALLVVFAAIVALTLVGFVVLFPA
jgi:hypothetical protein